MYNPKKKKKKKLIRKIIAILCILLALGIAGAAGVFVWASKQIKGTGQTGETLELTVPEGSGTATIASLLKENGLIENDTLFRIYSRLKKQDGTYLHGDHLMYVGSSYDELITQLQEMTYEEVETFQVSFPEGKTCLAMALTLEDMDICTVDEFIYCCNNDEFECSFWDEISDDDLKFIKLEGFLFPDTYDFPVGYSIHDIIQTMLTNFEEKVYTEEFKEKVEKSGLTLEENIILASIVEKETLGDEMYSMVAGVFKNRLENPDVFPHLESDTSAEHIDGNWIYGVLGTYYNGDAMGYVRNIPRSMIDAYDTYVVYGLPVGAICNPGLKAINGTVEPAEHGYYFFITDCDNNYYWGVTADDHLANIDKVDRYNDSH